jgi:methylthioribulose-1-phosphate dehydratase
MAAIHRRGWCDGTGGNFSVVLERSPELKLLMAPSGVDKGRVRPSQLILVNESAEVIGGQGRVSAEMPLHRAIVIHAGAGAVLHTHSQAATLLSRQALNAFPGSQRGSDANNARVMSDTAVSSAALPVSPDAGIGHLLIEGLEMLKGLEGIQTHHCQISIPVLDNDQNLARLSAAAEPHLEAAPHGILIAGHGLYAWGRDLELATRHLEILEFLLEQTWRQHIWETINGCKS